VLTRIPVCSVGGIARHEAEVSSRVHLMIIHQIFHSLHHHQWRKLMAGGSGRRCGQYECPQPRRQAHNEYLSAVSESR
jgi:hypothetical protein